MVKPESGRGLLVVMRQLVLCTVVSCVLTAAQRADIPHLIAELSSNDWTKRAAALDALASLPQALQTTQVRRALVVALDNENHLIEQTLRDSAGSEGVSDKYGEDYSGYYSQLLGLVARVANLDDSATLQILVCGSYNPESPLARQLARQGDRIAPFLLDRAQSDVAVIRQSTLAFIGQLVGKLNPPTLSNAARDRLVQTLVAATSDADIGVRKQALRGLQLIRDLNGAR